TIAPRSTSSTGPRVRGGARRVANPDGMWPWSVGATNSQGHIPSGLAVFYFWPVIQTAYFSFTTWGVFGGSEFTGLKNWIDLLESGAVPRALVNTLLYTAMV